MAEVSFTLTAELTGITASDLADRLCEQWGMDSYNDRFEDEEDELSQAEFIELMLKRYIKQTHKAWKLSKANATAVADADSEVE